MKNSLLLLFVLGLVIVQAQPNPKGVVVRGNDPVRYVDPFIGTGKSAVSTKWGNEGGTYPGAVAPWGLAQLTPETRPGGGYDYSDSVIGLFSCIWHHSGYPGGSAGALGIMPVPAQSAGNNFRPFQNFRPFRHQEEAAAPGYYKVIFSDDHTMVEATATARAGIFRFTFPAGVSPCLFLKGKGEWKGREYRILMEDGGRSGDRQAEMVALFRFSEAPAGYKDIKEGVLVDFPRDSAAMDRVIGVEMSMSYTGRESAARNIAVELGEEMGAGGKAGHFDFDRIREKVKKDWRKQLSMVSIDDPDEQRKKIFYTALYHSLLLPWIISDVDGNYRGADGRTHRVRRGTLQGDVDGNEVGNAGGHAGENEYGGFSPWDTYRSLHPLLCLLYPDRQRDMVRSMLDIYLQTGRLPLDPMTGVHAVPVIVDSYLKGIGRLDSILICQAIRKSIADSPYREEDRSIYRQLGYIPSRYPESVTRTVEYAYDDWAFSQLVERIPLWRKEKNYWDGQGYNYRNLFDPASLMLLPRREDGFNTHPGNAGYKEGDKWVYSYFVPQHPEDLVNLMGGDSAFSVTLDGALHRGDILFDNETVFHIPYLFNYAGRPDLTRYWIKTILDNRFAATPGGLPGNDDLGSMSSWYVFSALGLFPFCPGRPEYTMGVPIFQSATLHLQKGRTFVIRRGRGAGATGSGRLALQRAAGRDGVYGSAGRDGARESDGKPGWVKSGGILQKDRLSISHERLMRGGELNWTERGFPAGTGRLSGSRPVFTIGNVSVSRQRVNPHEQLWLRFTLHNAGVTGVKIIRLSANGKEIARGNCLVQEGQSVTDSLSFRLYAFGVNLLEVDGIEPVKIEVLRSGMDDPGPLVSGLDVTRSMKTGGEQKISYTVQNISGMVRRYTVTTGIQHFLLSNDQRLLPNSIQHLLPDSTHRWLRDSVQRILSDDRRELLPNQDMGQETDSLLHRDTVLLEPGESKLVTFGTGTFVRSGWNRIRVGREEAVFKVYKENTGSCLLDLSWKGAKGDSLIADGSGFGNHAIIRRTGGIPAGMAAEAPTGMTAGRATGKQPSGTQPSGTQPSGTQPSGKLSAGKQPSGGGDSCGQPLLLGRDCYLEVPQAASLDRMGETITMMGWVYPVSVNKGLTDLFTKGDNHVLQVTEGGRLSFFAGGWGRGDCTVDLPRDWAGRWHHIAGVCDGNILRVYIDGRLAEETKVDGRVNLSTTNRWVFGRNEEFPEQRLFDGYMDKMKVYGEALSADEIALILHQEERCFLPYTSVR